MLSKLRQAVQPLRRLLAWPFLLAGFSPATIGLLGIAMALLAAGLARAGYPVAAFWLAAGALLTDLADGEVARSTKSCTPEGNYLDALGDRICECLLLLGLLPFAPNLAALALAGGCLTSYAKARCSLVVSMDNRDWPGAGDYPDRAALLLMSYYLLPDPAPSLALLSAVSWICLLRRLAYARRMIRDAGVEKLQPYLRGSL